MAELVKSCKSIGRAPRRFPFVNKARDPDLRRRIHRSHLIFFDVGPDTVEILHVVHCARDYAQIVFADDESE